MTASEPISVCLVAEDPIWRAHLGQALLDEGMQVLQRPPARRLVDLLKLQQNPPLGLLIVQGHFAGVSLPALVKALRRHDSAIPLLLLLNEAEEEQRAALLDAGADDVLQQPFGLREFVARCRAILRRSRLAETPSAAAEQQTLMQVGPISLDREQCRVWLSDQEVNLTPREFRLLECFMLNPGRAMSREQLIEQVWGPDYNGDSKSVDVHVLWLRRKLDVAAPQPQLFITVRGIGYRLDPPRS